MPKHKAFLYLIGDNMDFATEIKQRIKIPELLQFYGFDIIKNRIKCPLHNGEDYNCGIKQEYIHCFVCGESADVIGFVMKYFGLTFQESITKLNSDFYLGLPIGEKLDRRKRIDLAKKSFKAKQERERQKNKQKRLENEYHKALDDFTRLDKQKIKYKPLNADLELHPLFVDAIISLPHAEYRLECAETELYLYETRNRCNT